METKHREIEIYFVTEDIKYTFFWWEFSKVQLYISHWYNQLFLIDEAYTRKSSVEVWQFAQCHHIWSKIQKYTCVWTRWQVYKKFFKECHGAPPEDEGSIEFSAFHDIVKLLMIRGESKYGFSTYYIKLCHGKNIFDHMLGRIGQMDLNGISSIDMISFRKSLKK